MSTALQVTTTTASKPIDIVGIDGSPERAESPAQNEEDYSSDDSEDDDEYEDDDSDSDYDSDEEDDEEPALGPLQRLSNALRTKQQKMLAKRRHPVLEWKAAAQWHADNAAGLAAAEQERKDREAMAAEKAARRERKVKRKAQRKFTKQKEVEFRTLLEDYSLAITKSEKRTALITQFAIENRSVEKQKLAAIEAAKRAEQLRDAAEKIALAEKRDEEEKQATLAHLQQCIEVSNEMGGGTVSSQLSPHPSLHRLRSRTRRLQCSFFGSTALRSRVPQTTPSYLHNLLGGDIAILLATSEAAVLHSQLEAMQTR